MIINKIVITCNIIIIIHCKQYKKHRNMNLNVYLKYKIITNKIITLKITQFYQFLKISNLYFFFLENSLNIFLIPTSNNANDYNIYVYIYNCITFKNLKTKIIGF